MHLSSIFEVSLLVLCAIKNVAVNSDVIVPQNIAVVSGNRMEMNCQIDSAHTFRSWTLQRLSDNLEQTVYQDNDHRPSLEQFGVDRNDQGSRVLYANSTTSNDAGTYRCLFKDKATKRLLSFSAQLIVFESAPSCQTNLTEGTNVSLAIGQLFFIHCRVRYHGSLNLTMQWKRNIKDGETSSVTIETRTITPKDHTTYALNMVADFSRAVTFSWIVFFTASGYSESGSSAAKNVPDYQYIWESPLILPTLGAGTVRPTASTVSTSSTAKEVVKSSTTKESGSLPTVVTARVEELLIEAVSQNWVIVMLAGIIVFLLIVTAVTCACIRSRNRSNAGNPRVYNAMNSIGSGSTFTSVNNETYDAIDDVVQYSEISRNSGEIQFRRPSVPVPGYATMTRRLPATPQGNQPNDLINHDLKKFVTHSKVQSNSNKQGKKGKTMERNRRNAAPINETLESVKSSSLPNLYNDPVAKTVCAKRDLPPHDGVLPVYSNAGPDESTCYLTADNLGGDEITSTYLEVNDLSKRKQDHPRGPYLDRNDLYLMPCPV